MNKITKDNKGITLVALIITVILMLILASVATYTGLNTYKNAKVNKFVTQMQLLQAKVDDLVGSKTIEELNSMDLQTPTTQEQQNAINSAFNNGEVTTNDASKYKVFTKNDVLNILDVENIENDIMVNFETREIVCLNGIQYNGEIYYTQYKLPYGQTIVNNDNSNQRAADLRLEFLIDGLNCEVTITNISITNGTLSFAESVEGNAINWQTITNYTEKENEYKINISKTGSYIFKLQDNTDNDEYVEVATARIVLINKPNTNLDLNPYWYTIHRDSPTYSSRWAYAEKDGINYVWIPRFVYKTNIDTNSTDIKFIKGNSNIATDNTYINDEWILHDKFTASDGTGLTGVWVTVDSPNQYGLDMIELLDSDAKTLTKI